MKQDNNAKKALSELASMVGVGKSDASKKTEVKAKSDTSVDFDHTPKPTIAEAMAAKGNKVKDTAPVKPVVSEAPVAPVEPVAPAAPVAPPVSKSVIANDMVINGSIVAKGDLDMLGSHTGTIQSEGVVMVTGHVEGDIEAKELLLQNCVVVAEQLTVANDVRIDDGSNITANISCENIIVNAALTGNIHATKSCRVNSTAVVTGNITAASISIGEGAVMNSKIEIIT